MEIKRYEGMIRLVRKRTGIDISKESPEKQERRLIHLQKSGDQNGTSILASEISWYSCNRPFYRVYPSIEQSLSELDISKVETRFLPDEYETIAVDVVLPGKSYASLIHYEKDSRGGCVAVSAMPEECEHFHNRGIEFLDYKPDGSPSTVNDIFEHLRPKMEDQYSKEDFEAWTRTVNLCLCVMIMKNDPSVVDPIICDRHKKEFELASESAKKGIHQKSAKLIGGMGYHFGRSIEAMPHTRRPHPALMWTGKGRKTPRIVLRKGCVVKRKKVTQVPTGYRITGDSQIAAK